MTTQTIKDLENIVREVWATDFFPALQQTNVLSNIFLRQDYSGDIKQQGSSVQAVSYTHLTLPTICSV